MNVVAISGSLRQQSYNTAALKAAQSLAPQGMQIELANISDVPLYDEDLRAQGEPESIRRLKAQIHAADAVLIASPEFNFSVPGVLKNTLDWLSRPPHPPFDGKAVAIMGASPGVLGTARAQYHLRQVLVYMNTFTVNKPEVFISNADRRFDAEGNLIDADSRAFIAQLLVSLHGLVLRLEHGKNPQK